MCCAWPADSTSAALSRSKLDSSRAVRGGGGSSRRSSSSSGGGGSSKSAGGQTQAVGSACAQVELRGGQVPGGLRSMHTGAGVDLPSPRPRQAPEGSSAVTRGQRRGSSSHSNHGPKRGTTPRGRTRLLQGAASISRLHQSLHTHLGQLDAVALAAASDR